MPKGKGKPSSGANETAKDKAVSVSEPQTTPAEPQIEEGAFAGLREKIEQRLKNQSSAKGKGKKDNKVQPSTENTPVKKEKNVTLKADKKQDSAHGKKRDRNGDVIAREEKEKKGSKKSEEKPDASQKQSNNDALRAEIMAMGGTEADLDLLADVDSESEVEGETSKRKAKGREADLRRELSNMLAAAGHVVPEDLADDEVSEVEEEEDEAEEDDEEEEEQEEGEEASDAAQDDIEDADEQDADSIEESDIEDAPPAPKAKETESHIPKEYAKLAVMPRSDWYNSPLPPLAGAKEMNALPRHLVERIHEQAKVLLLEENEQYAAAQKTSASSSYKFYTSIMSSGTLSDKISALTLAVQESPLHNTKSLESLVGLAGKRSRAQAVEVLRSLKDMFAQGTLLPSDRRLRSFANQPGLVAAFQGAGGRWTERDPLPGGLQKSHLMLWAFEDGVKEQFYEILKVLEVWCNDEIEFSRSRAVSYVYELLKEKPEQEANLLRLLVNKLGDPGKKIASRASYLLLQLEQQHPMMKPTIIKSVEELLFRPGQSSHAKYYAIITLNQTVLSMKEQQVAMQLLDIYFSLFVTLLKPAPKGQPPQGKHGKGKGKGNPNAEAVKGEAQTDEMREKLTSGVLTGVNRAYPFTDADSGRLSKHIDTLFRITHSSNFNTSIQALMLIQQLTHTTQVASDRFYRTLYESLLDPRVATSSKQSLYLNLLFKSLKNDLNVRRVKAFVKRIVQVLGMHQPSFICGIFYLIRELEKTFIGLSSLLDQPEDNDSDDEEVFRDVLDEDDEQPEPVPVDETTTKKPKEKYDPRKRDPEHSNAEETCLWELLPFTTHFHPSVSLNADRLLEHEPMSGKPDLTIHTLSHFLDRFIYRTPKSSAASRGASIMQPLAGGEAKDRLVEAGKTAMQGVPLNSENFWKKKAEDISAEDVFFHEYFNRVNKDKVKAKKGKPAATDDDTAASDDDEEVDEDAIWKALVDSRPDLEDEVDSDDDLDMDDLESAYDDDSAEEGVEGEDDDEVIFNDESDVPSDEEMNDEEAGDFEGFDSPPPTAKKSKAKDAPASKKSAKKDDEDDEDAFDMDVSDDEAFLDSDEDLPSDMELGGVELETAEPEPEENNKSKREKRRKLKHLPTFASADDYAALLDGEDLGM